MKRYLEAKVNRKAVALNPAELKSRLERLEERISALRRCL